MKQSDLEYLGKLDGRHSWAVGEECFYWTDGANVVTSDLAGSIPFCPVTLPSRQHGTPRTIKALTRTDAKRAIVEALDL
ncbi:MULTISPECIES: hypothetical protein [Aeromonas]|uniref:hypothetical protein n=1 Tax=Aeromonas TaxID=642 RepID=UPI00224D5ABB|nr:hypothetical protein [Aeromonas hydrophila]MCX4116772.1 hypothetical protein [Aeromonas hydrophila]